MSIWELAVYECYWFLGANMCSRWDKPAKEVYTRNGMHKVDTGVVQIWGRKPGSGFDIGDLNKASPEGLAPLPKAHRQIVYT